MDEARNTVDLNGSFEFKADAKGRVSLPAKFRKVLCEDLLVTKALSGDYLMVFDGSESFNAWVNDLFEDRFGGYKTSNREHQLFRSRLKGDAFEVQVDSAGRILLPAKLREEVGIERDVVIVGNVGYFEVWSDQRREQMCAEIDVSCLLS